MHRAVFLLCVAGCSTVQNDMSSHDGSLTLTREQVSMGCMPMGEGSGAHVMCNHGHSLSFRSENLYARWMLLDALGKSSISEGDLMMSGNSHGAYMLPDPLTPVLRASVGERVKIRVVSYGPQMHDFHIHGHLWMEQDTPYDTHALMPAQVYDGVEFYAGAGAQSSERRGGTGDWMYHCHVEPHMLSGMWGVFRVGEPTDTADLGVDGRYATELPYPVGGAGEIVDIWVVAAEVPLTVARTFDPVTTSLVSVDRMARVFVPMADAASFEQATALSVQQGMRTQKTSWLPWVMVLRAGTKARVHLRNLMRESPVSLHPHGVAYTVDNDGTMPGDVVWPGGEAALYEWTADTAGTWPLHDHARSGENVGRGLFGAIVVKTPEEESRLDRDYIVFFHDYDMNWMMGYPDGQPGMVSQH